MKNFTPYATRKIHNKTNRTKSPAIEKIHHGNFNFLIWSYSKNSLKYFENMKSKIIATVSICSSMIMCNWQLLTSCVYFVRNIWIKMSFFNTLEEFGKCIHRKFDHQHMNITNWFVIEKPLKLLSVINIGTAIYTWMWREWKTGI